MKFVIVFVALFAIACADKKAENHEGDAKVVKFESDVGPHDFKYHYETSNGIKEEAEGVLHNIDTDHESLAVHGSYSFKDKDGKIYTTKYTADEDGYKPEGEHLPKAS